MKIKKGVSFVGLQLPIRKVLVAADRIWIEHGKELVVTSGTDGAHSAGSLHYYGYALDLRTKYFPNIVKARIASELKRELGHDYDVVIHKTHIHAEYQQAIKKQPDGT